MHILLIGLFILFLVSLLVGWFNRKTPNKETPPSAVPADCCGAHEVCERDSLLVADNEIVYYDDEELDTLSGKPCDTYTQEEVVQIEAVFSTLQEADVAGWLRSLQLRNIELPAVIKEEALLIVCERRSTDIL